MEKFFKWFRHEKFENQEKSEIIVPLNVGDNEINYLTLNSIKL